MPGGYVLGIEKYDDLVAASHVYLKKSIPQWLQGGQVQVRRGNILGGAPLQCCHRDSTVMIAHVCHGSRADSGRLNSRSQTCADLTQDGTKFDAIHVGAAAAEVPEKLLNLLAPGGKMFIPVGRPHGAQVHFSARPCVRRQLAAWALLCVQQLHWYAFNLANPTMFML
jgi:Protein-L-isoaspartate(D-aspartate) O-methyltransferase (PCMT)